MGDVIDVLVDVFSHPGDFTVAPDLARTGIRQQLRYVAYFYLGGRRIYIGAAVEAYFQSKRIIVPPVFGRGVLTTFFILTHMPLCSHRCSTAERKHDFYGVLISILCVGATAPFSDRWTCPV